ncbi:MAG: Uroporphyrinogen decarboxylase (URO-D) [bacterium ADurb.Bin429]|nr:MAG: Uroporphyrinogen decarboxylase (URO-D) [bacterium ADurb.Bin429]
MTVLSSDHQRMVDCLLADTRANGGLAPLDIEQFWADQAVAIVNPFSADIPQCPLGIMMSGECVYDELRIPEDFWRYGHDQEWRLELHKAYNDLAEPIVGRRLLSEQWHDPALSYPPVKWLHDIFEAENVWSNGSWWLEQSAHTEVELAALLDRVDARLENLRALILPPNWDEEKARLTALGVKPPRYRGQRGPVTFATSIFGIENLIYLIMDNEPLAIRFRDTILRAMLTLGRVMDEECGDTPETAPHGFSFCDDNCYLLTPDMYELFAYPILAGMFARYSPNPGDSRYQHSDSAMSHLLPLLGRLGLTGTNFGPTVMVDDIRAHLPNAVIYGELAPFTFSRNEEAGIVAEFLRDFELTRATRGLVFSTAGSINNGSRLTGMRLIMAAIQRYGRY